MCCVVRTKTADRERNAVDLPSWRQCRVGAGCPRPNTDLEPAFGTAMADDESSRAKIELGCENSICNDGRRALRRADLDISCGGIKEFELKLIVAICRRTSITKFSLVIESARLLRDAETGGYQNDHCDHEDDFFHTYSPRSRKLRQ